MKCYTVVSRALEGEFKTEYLGNDLGEAKKVYRALKLDGPKNNMAVFFFPKPYSKRVWGVGRQFEYDAKQEEKAPAKKAPAKKKEDK